VTVCGWGLPSAGTENELAAKGLPDVKFTVTAFLLLFVKQIVSPACIGSSGLLPIVGGSRVQMAVILTEKSHTGTLILLLSPLSIDSMIPWGSKDKAAKTD
jgi:hypothetical protein